MFWRADPTINGEIWGKSIPLHSLINAKWKKFPYTCHFLIPHSFLLAFPPASKDSKSTTFFVGIIPFRLHFYFPPDNWSSSKSKIKFSYLSIIANSYSNSYLFNEIEGRNKYIPCEFKRKINLTYVNLTRLMTFSFSFSFFLIKKSIYENMWILYEKARSFIVVNWIIFNLLPNFMLQIG